MIRCSGSCYPQRSSKMSPCSLAARHTSQPSRAPLPSNLEHGRNDPLRPRGEKGWDLIGSALNQAVQTLNIVIIKRKKSAEKRIEQNPQAPDIGGWPQVALAADELTAHGPR